MLQLLNSSVLPQLAFVPRAGWKLFDSTKCDCTVPDKMPPYNSVILFDVTFKHRSTIGSKLTTVIMNGRPIGRRNVDGVLVSVNVFTANEIISCEISYVHRIMILVCFIWGLFLVHVFREFYIAPLRRFLHCFSPRITSRPLYANSKLSIIFHSWDILKNRN